MKTSMLWLCLTFLISLAPAAGAEEVSAEPNKVKVAKVQLKLIATALDVFRLDCGVYPTQKQGLQALLTDPGIDQWRGPYLKGKQVLKDPWKEKVRYRSSKVDAYQLDSAGPDKKFDTDDDVKHK